MTTLVLSTVVSALLGSGIDSTDASHMRSSILGMDVCMGPSASAEDCDIRIFPNEQDDEGSEPEGQAPPLSVDVLGMTICLGSVPSDVACDLRLEPAPQQEPPS